MKSLKYYIEELYATPQSTMGMGGITFPTETTPGSGDIPSITYNPKRKHKRKHLHIKLTNEKTK